MAFKKGNQINKNREPWNKGKTKKEYPNLSNSGVKKGNIPWNKGLIKENCDSIRRMANQMMGHPKYKNSGRPKGIPQSKKYKKLRSESMKGNKNHFYGKKHTQKTKEKMKKAWVKNKNDEKNYFKRVEKMSQKTRNAWKNNKLPKKILENLKKVSKKTRFTKESRSKLILPKKDTKIEVKIQNFLKQLNIEFFTHQYMKIKHGYQCDILIPSINLVIECDGDYWHKYPIGLKKDHIRTKELIENGFKVLRLWEHEIKTMKLNDFKIKLEEK